uniref:Uncharacterized protein n=1 Tax=Cacopsylla melanoneura TaxID=428564 RepID=A0A8D8SG89_9HEMI
MSSKIESIQIPCSTLVSLQMPHSSLVYLLDIESVQRGTFICIFKKIRLNEPYSILSYEFDLSPTYLGTIFRNVLPRVAECLEKFIFWPSKRQVFLKVSFNI